MIRYTQWMVVLLLIAGSLAAQDSELEEARRLASQGRLSDALQIVERRIAADDSAPGARFVKGVILARAGRGTEAESVFLELTRTHPDYPEPFNNLAVLYSERGDYERAVEILKQALGTHSSYRTAYDNLTKVYGKLASRAYDRALGQESSAPVPGPSLSLLTEFAGNGGGGGVDARKIVVREPLSQVAPKEPLPSPAAPEAEMAPVTSAVESELPAASSEESASAEIDATEIAAMVRAWAAAWSDQRSEDYLSFYTSDYAPEGMSRSQWQSQRRVRIARPRFIEVAVESIAVRPAGDGRAQVRFRQSYRSDTFEDEVVKVLDLVLEGGDWRIDRETASAL